MRYLPSSTLSIFCSLNNPWKIQQLKQGNDVRTKSFKEQISRNIDTISQYKEIHHYKGIKHFVYKMKHPNDLTKDQAHKRWTNICLTQGVLSMKLLITFHKFNYQNSNCN